MNTDAVENVEERVVTDTHSELLSNTLPDSNHVSTTLSFVTRFVTSDGMNTVGAAVGTGVGALDGCRVGDKVGVELGRGVGLVVGVEVGAEVGTADGPRVGARVGGEEGPIVGRRVGECVGAVVGRLVGLELPVVCNMWHTAPLLVSVDSPNTKTLMPSHVWTTSRSTH
jgi:tetrahydromethanopterin S-methyltransferase subunit G